MKIVFGALIIIISSYTFSCRCSFIDFETRVNTYENIFLAQLIKAEVVKPSEEWSFPVNHIDANFRVIETLKGNASRFYRGKTNIGPTACGLKMEVGAQYLVFSRNGSLDVGICSGTRLISTKVYETTKREIESIINETSNK